MDQWKVLAYYKQPEISKALVENAANREVAGRLLNGMYDKRPDVLQYEADVVSWVQRGVTSFHYSVELWRNPMLAGDEKARIGWDLVLDMDSSQGIELAKDYALVICKVLKKYGIENQFIKFSGSRGFHIILPWKMFPYEINYEPLRNKYPEIPRAIARFLKSEIAKIKSFQFIELEENWGKRHMFRAPYSLNEKTWLVSIPISSENLKNFKTDFAKPESVRMNQINTPEKGEAEQFLIEVLDWNSSVTKEESKKEIPIIQRYDKIPEQLFPPCMKIISSGLEDGKKRSLFALIQFLRCSNWTEHDIRNYVFELNKKNTPNLSLSIIDSTLRYNLMKDPVPPPNCRIYYEGIKVCNPDSICEKIKNPVSYGFKKSGPKDNIYKCSTCSKGFPSMKSLNVHRTRMH